MRPPPLKRRIHLHLFQRGAARLALGRASWFHPKSVLKTNDDDEKRWGEFRSTTDGVLYTRRISLDRDQGS
jgi:hypothetical protein